MYRYIQQEDGERMETLNSKKSVHIHLRSIIKHPNQPKEVHEMRMIGELIDRKGISYLRYEEGQNGDSVLATVKLDAHDALIMRKGSVNMRLPFETGIQRTGTYRNGPVSFYLAVHTKQLAYTKPANGSAGKFAVHYNLSTEDGLLGTYELTITYSEGKL